MRTPPLLIGCGAIFWGLETERLLLGFCLALLFEASLVVTTRYDLKEEHFIRISDLTSVLFLGSVALILLNYEPVGFLRISVSWLPPILSPLLVAQQYSKGDTVIIGTQLGTKGRVHMHKPLDFRIYYFFICIFGAAAGNSRGAWFFPLLAILIGYLLCVNRGKSSGAVVFVCIFSMALGLGGSGFIALERMHQLVMQKSFRLIHGYYREKMADPYKSHVNFGETGRMKLSQEIIMRIKAEGHPPRLLREASYSLYRNGDWFGNQGDFEFLQPAKKNNWQISEPSKNVEAPIRIEQSLPKEKGLLVVPYGGYRVESETIFELERSASGVIKVVDGATIIGYDIYWDKGLHNNQDKPRERNLDVPEKEKELLQSIVAGLHVNGLVPAKRLQRLHEYFGDGFTYSLEFTGKGDGESPLVNFLQNRKSGFCEYYATSSVLLLRAMGIPSRYVVGFALREKGWQANSYVVRKRHAHAWAEAYVDGRWHVVDTTPSSWFGLDARRNSPFQGVYDLLNYLRHEYKLLQIGTGEDYTLYYSLLVIVLTAFLVIRIYRRMKLQAAEGDDPDSHIRFFERIYSPLTPVVDWLDDQGQRNPDETFGQMGCRYMDLDESEQDDLDLLFRLHLCHRFDPKGLPDDELDFLNYGARRFRERLHHRMETGASGK